MSLLRLWSVSSHLGVAEKDDADDLVADGGAESRDGGGGEGGALAVATGNNLRVGAPGVGQVEERGHLLDGRAAGAGRKGVVGEAGRVAATDALHPDIGSAEGRLEVVADIRTKSALQPGQ